MSKRKRKNLKRERKVSREEKIPGQFINPTGLKVGTGVNEK